ncbi:multiple epidermal growth factor-like domains protein 6 [Megalops cyprinoides]|uniref:multiple epidermal growth factor-like domains protein 6 n=1 Tax=Megalops cyprinoides TaxID=118141 RepID=UPI001863F255|nr:multiple epidermal growth factor-like domains protein 6 [Megalops cyprinoides]
MLKPGVLCLALLALTAAITCPDGGTCDDGSTCCQRSSGRYGCCPLPNAVCCEDHLHCCHEGTVCDLKHSKCINETHSLAWLKRVPAKLPGFPQSFPMIHASSRNEDYGSICPDNTHCPFEYTCLKSHNAYECCPLTQGVLCSDGKHCCPEGHLCSEDGHSCVKQAGRVDAVICPDEASECPEQTTCCQLPDSSWGCCPMAKAVCCEDKIHCCPEGDTCDLVHGKCLSPHGERPMWKKFPARRREAWEDQTAVRETPDVDGTSVICPDGKACQDGMTCCQLSNGSYGCCPFPNAVCCEDHKHCCPEGTQCDLAHRACISPSGSRGWATKLQALRMPPREIKAKNVPCNDSVACPDGSTCCKTASGDWACCPLPQAVCCEDHQHCCPHGTTCDPSGSKCDNATVSVPWLKKVPALTLQPHKAGVVACDSSHACPDGSTCCKTASGDWACCPLPQAVCCEDHQHCCPHGTTCDPSGSKCDNATVSVPWLKKVPALTLQPHNAGVVPCDSSHACPDGSTCCKTASGDWACCPLPQAVCCEDHQHCCPHGTTCDPSGSKCDNATVSVPWLKKVPALTLQPHNAGVVACDSSHACPDGSTCCKTASGDWACCPLPQAVCCEDHQHCCPHGTTCDPSGSKCDNATVSVPWLKKVPALTLQPHNAGVVPCDSSHACPDGSTCCKTASGDWACCPLPQAVCCEDHQHCCPHGTTCDPSGSKCDNATVSVPWLKKVPALTLQPHNAGVVACDSSHACPDGSTCCKTASGDWACCPLPQAVCCEDHQHCCPHGTTCDPSGSKCDNATVSVPWLKKVPALTLQPHNAGVVPCDSSHACPDGSTCCKTASGDWACCPLPQAVCCEDHQHCCPHGTTCDPSGSKCDNATVSVPWLKKVPALTLQPHNAGVVACDSSHACPDGSTCCKTASGDWACCPLPQAVCCEDHQHCCPHGTTCDPSGSKCDNATVSVPWLKKVPALTLQPHKAGVVACDSSHACPDGSTCCKTASGDWACCPLPQAVCCEDHQHCCPHGTTCDPSGSKCDNATVSVPWLKKVPALTLQPHNAGVVPCDSSHACPDGSTCCKTASGDWACCPLPQAVCCEDHQHCCPHGTTCDPSGSKCDNATVSVPWLKKVPALTLQPHKAGVVACDSSHACPDGSTCCKTASGDWACCPLPQAVCCEDHQHCCPHGTTCDPSGSKCDNATVSVPWLKKVPALFQISNEVDSMPRFTAQLDNIQCNSSTSCPKDTTCCFVKRTGKWGCCPLPKAVCCADGEHCCPFGYKCNERRTSCSKGRIVIPWYTKTEALISSGLPTDVECDSHSSCPTGSTCCSLPKGQWGCCPLEKAVCCSDQKHCCPQGYTCNPESGNCEKMSGMRVQQVPLAHFSEPERQPRPVVGQDVQCGDNYLCSDEETCCRTSATTWACCPYPQAVCCSDMKHCCPAGFTCDPKGGSCSKSARLRWDSWDMSFGARRPFLQL